jgi:hypothetical protein
MADSAEPKKETVRIMVPIQTGEPMQTGAPKRETVRIQLPSRPPANVPGDSSPAAAPLPSSVSSPPVTPKKETARITVLPDPPVKPTVQMKKTQPLIDLPPPGAPSISVTVAPETGTASENLAAPSLMRTLDDVRMPFCWALLAVSVIILLIQIWSYFS